MTYLALYGAQNLINNKFSVSVGDNIRGFSSPLQTLNNARFAGSTVVDRKIEDKELSLSGKVRATDDLSLQEVMNEYSKAFNKEDRYFRLMTNYHVFTPMEASTGWQVSGDTTGLSFDSEVYQYGLGSIKFDADVSEANGYTEVYTESATETDLSSYGNTGNFEAWVYLPQTEDISSIELSVGSDSSNYYSNSATQQYDGEAFEVGWNYVSYRFLNMNETGTPDPYNFGSYVDIKVNYSGGMVDRSDFRVGGILWQEDSRSRNYRAFVSGFRPQLQHSNVTVAQFSLGILAYEGISESTGSFNVYSTAGNTTAVTEGEVELDGTYNPLPIISVDINSATNVSGVTLSNTTTGDSVLISDTYAASDKLVIDTDNREVTLNGSPVDYDDVLPRFDLGENDIQVSIATTSEEDVTETTQDINLTGEI